MLKANKKSQVGFSLSSYKTNLETLRQRLARLETAVDPMEKSKVIKRTSRSMHKFENEEERSGKIEKKIDKEALYRNLIKYYMK